MALNYMVFTCELARARKRARKTQKDTVVASTEHAASRAVEAYQRKDYTSAGQWANAATRSSLEVC